MQHYGAPTRILDWTENSLYRTLFFAVTDAKKGDASVWILDPYWLNHKKFEGVTGAILPDWEEADKGHGRRIHDERIRS